MRDLLRFALIGIAGWTWCCLTGHKPEHANTRICRCGTSLWRNQ